MRSDREASYARDERDASLASAGALRGRVCVVTGATRGIGRATALGLARRGATVIVLARDAERGTAVLDEVQRAGVGRTAEDASLVLADLASLRDVCAAADEIADRHPAVHVLVNNAGVNTARRAVSADGIELTLAVNHVAPFALARRLLPALRAGAPSRVINVTSVFERLGRIDFADLQGERRWGGLRAYYQSKLANVLFTRALAERWRDEGITVNCVLPGLVATDLLREYAWWRPPWLRALWRRALLSPEQAAAGVVRLAAAPELARVTGRSFDRRGRPVRTSARSRDRAAADRLWTLTEALVDSRCAPAPPG